MNLLLSTTSLVFIEFSYSPVHFANSYLSDFPSSSSFFMILLFRECTITFFDSYFYFQRNAKRIIYIRRLESTGATLSVYLFLPTVPSLELETDFNCASYVPEIILYFNFVRSSLELYTNIFLKIPAKPFHLRKLAKLRWLLFFVFQHIRFLWDHSFCIGCNLCTYIG